MDVVRNRCFSFIKTPSKKENQWKKHLKSYPADVGMIIKMKFTVRISESIIMLEQAAQTILQVGDVRFVRMSSQPSESGQKKRLIFASGIEDEVLKKTTRIEVYNKLNGHCAYCGKVIKYGDMQVDHLTPKRSEHLYRSETSVKYYVLKGASVDALENLMPSCRRCNHYKRSYSLEDFRRLMLTLHKRVESQYINKVAINYGIIEIEPFGGVFYFEKTHN